MRVQVEVYDKATNAWIYAGWEDLDYVLTWPHNPGEAAMRAKDRMGKVVWESYR